MAKTLSIAAPLVLAFSVSFPFAGLADDSHTYTGRVTARTATSISIYDEQIVTVAIDDRTTVTPWIREKPFVRKTSYLTASAVKVGSLVTVRTRGDSRVADLVRVSSDTRKTFSGRVTAYGDSFLSVYDKEMAVVTLTIADQTKFTQLITVKPWVRKTVHLQPSALKVGAFVNMYPSKLDATVAGRVEIATDMPVRVPDRLPSNVGN